MNHVSQLALRREISREKAAKAISDMHDRSVHLAVAQGGQIVLPPSVAHNVERSQLEDLQRMIAKAHAAWKSAMHRPAGSNGRRKKTAEMWAHLQMAFGLADQLNIDHAELGEWAAERWNEQTS